MIYLKSSILILLFSLISFTCFSQQVLSSGGNAPFSTSTSETFISFTIGEPLITTGGIYQKITQGFQQPNNLVNINTAKVNAFSPNNDGNNDTWQFKAKSENYVIEIFSRWGNIVWDNKLDNTLSEWNGNDKKEKAVPDGTYYYSITLNANKIKSESGFIEITR